MASRLHYARKSSRAYINDMESFWQVKYSHKDKAQSAMADYTWLVHEARPYYRNRRNRKVLQRDAMKHGYGCTGAGVRAFTIYVNLGQGQL